MLPNAPVQSQQSSSVEVEHFINAESTSDVVVQDAPIAENLFIDHDSSSVPHSSPVMQPTQYSIAADRPRWQINSPKRLIEECNIVAYALSCAEEVEDNAEPSNYNEAIISSDCNN